MIRILLFHISEIILFTGADDENYVPQFNLFRFQSE